MYYKDKIRLFFSDLLKIDKQFLSRINVLKSYSFNFLGDEYEFQLSNKELYLRNLSSDFDVFEQVFMQEQYKFGIELIKRIYSDRKLQIFDIGSNIGLTSIYLSQTLKDSKFTLIEPDNDNFKQLRKNTEKYLEFNLINAALWFENTELFLQNNFRDRRHWARSVSKQKSGLTNQIPVNGFTLNKLKIISEFTHIDVVKVDIEGAEFDYFKNLDKNEEELISSIKVWMIEIHQDKGDYMLIVDYFTKLGFQNFSQGEVTYFFK